MRPKHSTTRLSTAAALLLSPVFPLLLPHSLAAQTPLATPQVRVIAPVAGSAFVALKGNTSPLARAEDDRGAAAPTQPSGRLRLLLKRSPTQEQALTEYLGSLHDPNSPSYHKWLTPASFGANFGIADEDLQAVEAWLAGQGLKVESVPASRNFVEFSGTLGQVAQAFHTSIHNYTIGGVHHLSNVSDPQIPAALSPVVAGVSPLNDFRAKPMHVPGRHVAAKSEDGILRVTPLSDGAQPSLTGGSASSPFLAVTPADAATIYNAPNFLNRNPYAGTARTGAGAQIGLVGDSDLPVADYLNYRRLFLKESSPAGPTIIIDGVDPGTNGDAVEALLDTELSAGLAPSAQIYYYASASDLLDDGVYDASLRAVEDNVVGVLSVSYGACELELGQAGNNQFASLWQQAAAQGITVVVSSGDNGAAACDGSSDTETAVSQGLAVSGFASTPYNVAVGGTDFFTLSNNFSTYVSAAGTGSAYLGSALGYIPENPWNDSISNNPPGNLSTNLLETYTLDDGTTTTLPYGGGGGPSTAGLCTTVSPSTGVCLAPGYPAPPFQSGINLGSTAPAGVRYLPDVSLFSAPGNSHPAGWALCADASLTGSGTQTDCIPDATGQFYLTFEGGTSAAAPAFAGMLAQIIESKGGQRLGLANSILYNLADGPSGSQIFHDVTAGNISVNCVAGSPNCAGNGFLTGYNATTGYDLATGLGSVNLAQLITSWDAAAFTATSLGFTINGATNAVSVPHGTSIVLGASVTPGSAAGTVSVNANPASSTNTQGAGAPVEIISLNSGSGSTSVNTLPGGNYNLQAYYPGDVSHSPSKSPAPGISVNITPEASTDILTLSVQDPYSQQGTLNPKQVSYGQIAFANAQPVNATYTNTGVANGPATGNVSLLNNGTLLPLPPTNGNATNPQTLNSQGLASYALYELAPGTYSLSASFPGDHSYNPSTSATVPLTITKGPTQLTLTPASTTIAASGSTTVKVELDTDSIGAYPAGAITLAAGSNTFTGSAVAQGLTQYGAADLIVTFNVPGSALASGANTLTATFAGDTNYSGTTATTTITNSGGSSTAPGISLFSQTQSVTVSAPGQSSAPDTITVTPVNGFSGTVNLTCQVQFSILGSAPTCSLASSSVNVSGGKAATTTVTVHTTGSSASLTRPFNTRPGNSTPAMALRLLGGGGGLAVCSVLLWGIPARRRSWRQLRSLRSLGLLLLTAGALGILGCGGTSTSNNNGNGTPTGSYLVTITGTATGVNPNNTQITVNVQ